MGSVLDTVTSAATLPLAAVKDGYTMVRDRRVLDEEESDTWRVLNETIEAARPEKKKD